MKISSSLGWAHLSLFFRFELIGNTSSLIRDLFSSSISFLAPNRDRPLLLSKVRRDIPNISQPVVFRSVPSVPLQPYPDLDKRGMPSQGPGAWSYVRNLAAQYFVNEKGQVVNTFGCNGTKDEVRCTFQAHPSFPGFHQGEYVGGVQDGKFQGDGTLTLQGKSGVEIIDKGEFKDNGLIQGVRKVYQPVIRFGWMLDQTLTYRGAFEGNFLKEGSYTDSLAVGSGGWVSSDIKPYLGQKTQKISQPTPTASFPIVYSA